MSYEHSWAPTFFMACVHAHAIKPCPLTMPILDEERSPDPRWRSRGRNRASFDADMGYPGSRDLGKGAALSSGSVRRKKHRETTGYSPLLKIVGDRTRTELARRLAGPPARPRHRSVHRPTERCCVLGAVAPRSRAHRRAERKRGSAPRAGAHAGDGVGASAASDMRDATSSIQYIKWVAHKHDPSAVSGFYYTSLAPYVRSLPKRSHRDRADFTCHAHTGELMKSGLRPRT